MYNLDKKDIQFIKATNHMDPERLYLLKQEAELYDEVQNFLYNFNDAGLTAPELITIWKLANNIN